MFRALYFCEQDPEASNVKLDDVWLRILDGLGSNLESLDLGGLCDQVDSRVRCDGSEFTFCIPFRSSLSSWFDADSSTRRSRLVFSSFQRPSFLLKLTSSNFWKRYTILRSPLVDLSNSSFSVFSFCTRSPSDVHISFSRSIFCLYAYLYSMPRLSLAQKLRFSADL